MKILLVIIALLLFNFSCTHIEKTSSDSKTSISPNSESLGFAFIYSSNLHGEIASCGCRNNPLGGVQRRLNWQNSLPAELPKLLIDSGDTFFSTTNIPEFLVPQSLIQAKNITESMNELKIDYYTPGENDLSIGLSHLLSILRNSKFKTINSNLVYKNSSKSIFTTHSIHSISKQKIGIFGLIDPELVTAQEVQAQDPIQTAKEIVKLLKKEKVDKVVLLSHLGTIKDEQLIKEVDGIDFIFSAHSMNYLINPIKINNTLIFEPSLRGEHVGYFDGTKNQLVEMSDRYDSKSNAENKLDKIIIKNKKEIATMNQTLDQILLREDSHVTKFKTQKSCTQCHEPQAKFVNKTRHSNAYHTLVKKGQHENLECLQCHTLGLNQPGGYRKLSELKPELQNVQCESCHGAGGHNPTQKVSIQNCLQCHTEARSDGWYRDGKPNFSVIYDKFRLMSCPSLR